MRNQEHLTDQFIHFVDSHHGVYSGQIFAQQLNELYKQGKIKGLNHEEWKDLLGGPENEFYIEAWANIESAEVTDDEGKEFIVFQNEGIFLCPKEIQGLIDWEQIYI